MNETGSFQDINHGEGNPRNSEGAFLPRKDGSLLFVWSHYHGKHYGDCDQADLAAAVSRDDGRTWELLPEPVVADNAETSCLMSVSLYRLPDDRILLLYLAKRLTPTDHVGDCRPYVRFSSDEGKSWSDAIDVTGAPMGQYFVVNNDRLIRTKAGRLIIPLAFHRFIRGNDLDPRSFGLHFYSDDNGQNWQEGTEMVFPTIPSTTSGLQEPGIVELADGSLLGYARTADGGHFFYRSTDGGMRWSRPEFNPDFTAPNSPLSIKRNPHNGELTALWNDYHTEIPGRPAAGRTPLTLARSRDEGKSWFGHRILESEADRGYCYTAMHFTRQALLLAYCCGGGTRSPLCLQDLRIRRIPLGELS